MAKRNITEITLPHNVTLKADKLTDRTFRSVKPGDYLLHTMDVRGTQCTFYAKVDSHSGNGTFSLVFGSKGGSVDVVIPKGDKVDVYRPI